MKILGIWRGKLKEEVRNIIETNLDPVGFVIRF